jgi:uncharacterized protein (TIGR02300 family)
LAFDTDALPVYGRPDFTKTEVPDVAREELGTKRVCPETGKKFYDLNKDPVVSPYTGKSYPLSFFVEVVPVRARKESAKAKVVEDEEVEAEEEVEEEDEAAPELISLEDAEEDEADDTVDNDDEEELPDLPDDVEIEVEEEDDEVADPFLEEEEEDDDLSDVIGDVDGEEEV